MKHRADVPVNTHPYPNAFRPRHCAGTDCLYDHPGDRSPWRWLTGWRRTA